MPDKRSAAVGTDVAVQPDVAVPSSVLSPPLASPIASVPVPTANSAVTTKQNVGLPVDVASDVRAEVSQSVWPGSEEPPGPSRIPAASTEKAAAVPDVGATSALPVSCTALAYQLIGVPCQWNGLRWNGPFGPLPHSHSGPDPSNARLDHQQGSNPNTLDATTSDSIRWNGPFGPQPSALSRIPDGIGSIMDRQLPLTSNQGRQATLCRFSKHCARRNCWYRHPEGRYIDESTAGSHASHC